MPPFSVGKACRRILASCLLLIIPKTGGAATTDEDWLVFHREADPTGFVITIDLSVSSGRRSPASLDCYEMRFQFSSSELAENGMPNAEVQAMYYAAEESVVKSIAPSGGRIVATRTGQQLRSVWLCGSKAMASKVQEAVDAIKSLHATFKPAGPADIRALHPTVLETQLAYNFQIFEHLSRQGDDLSVPRKTSHFIYGHTSTSRPLIEARLKTLGFQLDPNRPDINPKALVFFRFAPLDLDALDSDVRTLSKLCTEFGCDYDGWETEVAKRVKN
jgi:hypothetical protein